MRDTHYIDLTDVEGFILAGGKGSKGNEKESTEKPHGKSERM